MRRLLLSQSQVSLFISSSVVLVFTVLLFLSGYVIQQRTVKGLQMAIKPRIPKPPPSMIFPNENRPSHISSRLFRKPATHITYADLNRDIHSASINVDWRRLAHVQLARSHQDVCSAIMVLAELHRMKSPARRVLLFPKSWAEERKSGKGDVSDPYMDSTRRLMRMAARRYHVELHPIEPVQTPDGAETYSLASAYALHVDFDRLLTIETPGLLLDAEPLDAILGFTESAPFVMLHDTRDKDWVHAEDLFLLEPSKAAHADITSKLSSPDLVGFNDTYLPTLFSDPVLLASSDKSRALIRSVGVLHDVAQDFNQTAFLSDVAYIRFSDPKLPGPQYEVPWSDKVAARPKNKDADWTWTKLYGEFAQARMEICGLDLESWRP